MSGLPRRQAYGDGVAAAGGIGTRSRGDASGAQSGAATGPRAGGEMGGPGMPCAGYGSIRNGGVRQLRERGVQQTAGARHGACGGQRRARSEASQSKSGYGAQDHSVPLRRGRGGNSIYRKPEQYYPGPSGGRRETAVFGRAETMVAVLENAGRR